MLTLLLNFLKITGLICDIILSFSIIWSFQNILYHLFSNGVFHQKPSEDSPSQLILLLPVGPPGDGRTALEAWAGFQKEPSSVVRGAIVRAPETTSFVLLHKRPETGQKTIRWFRVMIFYQFCLTTWTSSFLSIFLELNIVETFC